MGVVLSGVAVDCGLVVLFGDEFMFELLLLPFGVAVVVVVELGLVLLFGALMSELLELVVDEGETVEDGELEPVLFWLEEFDGELCALLEPLPAPFPSLPVVELGVPLWAMAIPAEKMTAVAIVRIVFRILSSPGALVSAVWESDGDSQTEFAQIRKLQDGVPQEATTERCAAVALTSTRSRMFW